MVLFVYILVSPCEGDVRSNKFPMWNQVLSFVKFDSSGHWPLNLKCFRISGSNRAFFSNGITGAYLSWYDTSLDDNEAFAIWVITGSSSDRQNFSSHVGMGSRSQDFVAVRLVNFDISFSVAGVKVNRNSDELMLPKVCRLSFEHVLNFSVISSQIILILYSYWYIFRHLTFTYCQVSHVWWWATNAAGGCLELGLLCHGTSWWH